MMLRSLGSFTTLHVATLLRSLGSFTTLQVATLLRSLGLSYYVTCWYAAEISGIFYYVTGCYACEILGICLLRYRLTLCGIWLKKLCLAICRQRQGRTKMSCYTCVAGSGVMSAIMATCCRRQLPH